MLHLATNVEGQPVLVIGAGAIAAHKSGLLVDAGALVDVIAAELLAPLPEGVRSVEVRPYHPGDLDGYFLVVSATGSTETNDQIVAEAEHRRIWLNVVDDPERSNFYFAATHRSGEVVVSVSTEGGSPALGQILRDRIAASLPENLDEVVARLRVERRAMHARGQSTEGFDWVPQILAMLDPDGSAVESQAAPAPSTPRPI